MKNSTEVLLRRKHKLILEKASTDNKTQKAIGESQSAYLLCLLKNIEDLGYTFSGKLIGEIVNNYSEEDIGKLYVDILPVLKVLAGTNIRFRPMYRDFPQYVMNADYVHLFMNAIMHYMSLGTWMPDESYKANERLPLIEDTRLKVIDLGTEDDIKELANNIISSATSISAMDEDDFTRIIKDYNIVIDPDKIIFKENIALIGKIILDLYKSDDSAVMNTLYDLFNTATDVLRLAVALCDGDKSLAANTKFTGFKRYQRRVILGLIQNIITRNRDESLGKNLIYGAIMVVNVPNEGKFDQVLGDMNKYRQRWIRLAEVLHSREYAKPGSKFYYAAMAIQIIRTDNMPESYGHKTERYYFTKQYDKLIDHLKKRPGELGRRMDSILRGICAIPDSTTRVGYLRKFYAAYTEVADKISSTELLQILSHFKNRASDSLDEMRAFFPKGTVQKYYVTKNYMESIPQDVCNTMVKHTTNALVKIYSSRKALGSVYISPSMKNYIVPYSQRSASNTTRPITRGSQFPINKNAKCLRAFVWWTNIEYDESSLNRYSGRRVDIDLSSCVLNEDFIRIGEIWYGRLSSHAFKGVHSGDITNGGDFNGDGASEFIDIDIDSILKNGGRYVAFTVHSFTNQPFDEIGHLRFGWMEREQPNSGEIYEPKTVKMAMDVNGTTTFCVPVLFDCLERKAIWADLPGQNKWFTPNNIHSTDGVMTYAIKAILFSGKTNMYDLIELNAKARGHIIEDRSLADTIFEPEEETEQYAEVKPLDEKIKVYSPYDVDYFMSDLL